MSSKIRHQILPGSLVAFQTIHTYAEGHHKKPNKKRAGHKKKKNLLSPHLAFIYLKKNLFISDASQ